MNTDGVYGYNAQEVAAVSEKMIWHGANVLGYLTDEMQKNFINPMAENWVCKEAQDFFVDFKEKIEKLAVRVNERMHTFYDALRDSSRLWAERTGGFVGFSWNQNFVPNLDISNIKENVNGIRGINMKNVPEILNYLTSIVDKTREDMNQVKSYQQRVPFLGADQQEKLADLIYLITMDIEDSVAFVINGVQMGIKNTLTKYGDTASLVSGKLSDASK